VLFSISAIDTRRLSSGSPRKLAFDVSNLFSSARKGLPTVGHLILLSLNSATAEVPALETLKMSMLSVMSNPAFLDESIRQGRERAALSVTVMKAMA